MVQITNAAESNRASIRYIKEAVWGTTPASGNTYEMRLTKSGLEASKDTKVSEEIRADRMVPNIIEVAASSGGDIDVEFSAGSLDPFFEGFLLSSFNTAVNFFQLKGTAVSVTGSNTITLAGGDYRAYFTVGKWVKLEGFLTSDNNRYVQVSAKNFASGNTTLDVAGTFLVAEVGTAYTKILDAGDVLVANTAATFAAGNTLDGGGANAFANIKVGQKIYIEGIGKEVGTVQALATDPADGSTVTVYDGVSEAIVFEFHTAEGLITEGHYFVPTSGTPATLAANLAAAINKNFQLEKFNVSATVATDTVTLTNHNRTGGSIVASAEGVSIDATNFAGGSATKGGFYTVQTVIDSDTLTTVETLTADTNVGAKTVVVKGSHIKNESLNNNIVKQSFSIETGFTDVSKYFLMNGMRVGGIELSVDTGNIVSGKVTFMGRETVRSNSATLTGGAYTPLDATGTDVLNATSNVGQITKDGAALTSAIMKLNFKGENGLREQRAIGEKFPAGIGYGRISLTGSFSAYFDSFDLYDTFINHVTTSLGFDFSDVDHNTYFFSFPALKVTSDKIVPDGIDKDVMDDTDFTVQRDPVLKTMMMVDRFSSVRPVTGA